MSYCECDGDTSPAFYKVKFVRAKVQHRCCECGAFIEVGSTYEYTSGKWEEEFSVFKTCERCSDLRSSIGGCWYYGGLKDMYSDYLYWHFLADRDKTETQYRKVFGV